MENQIDMVHKFIDIVPKAELHLHIEGSLEPELLFEIAGRNKRKLKYPTVESLKAAYSFKNLQEFLDIYYEGADVLIKETDFYDLTMAYLKKAHEDQVVHTEIFFDPQTHLSRGVSFETVINGITAALKDGEKKYHISTSLILCFLRHLSEASAMETFEKALAFRDLIRGVGLDSSEVGHPPSKFSNVFAKARDAGFITVAHAGEEGPSAYIREALNLLKVIRIDHGIRSMDDPELVQELVSRQIPLTVCPLSNLKLKVVPNLRQHPLKAMLHKGLCVTVNSDDPAYFDGYLGKNFHEITNALDLTLEDVSQLARNSFNASFLEPQEKSFWIQKIDELYSEFKTKQ
jgi:adenine deaminase